MAATSALLAVGLGAVPSAGAAVRYGTGSDAAAPCTYEQPCDIRTAVEGASDGDVVELGYCDIEVLGEVRDTARVTIEGSKPTRCSAPEVVSTHALSFSDGPGLVIDNPGSVVRDLAMHNTEPNSTGMVFRGRLAERVQVGQTGAGSYACEVDAGTLRDAVCEARADADSAAVASDSCTSPSSVSIRNVTAQSTGIGMLALGRCGHATALDVVNTFVRGETRDVLAKTDAAAGSSATLTLSHSNFRTSSAEPGGGRSPASVTDAGANQSAEPPAQAPSGCARPKSPLIDAGTNDPANGELDLNRNLRTIEGRTDIGATEFAPCPAMRNLRLSRITGQTAEFAASVNTHGTQSSYEFRVFRPIAPVAFDSFGGPLAATLADQPVSARATELIPATRYRVHLSSPAPPYRYVKTPGPEVAFATRGVRLLSPTVTVRRTSGALHARCSWNTPGSRLGTTGRCRGRIRLVALPQCVEFGSNSYDSGYPIAPGSPCTGVDPTIHLPAEMPLGERTFSLAAGHAPRMLMRLPRRALHLLKNREELLAREVVWARDGLGPVERYSRYVVVTLIGPKKRG